MARMFPRQMPSWVRQNPLRSTECRVFDHFEHQLPDAWSVFYSRPWLGLTSDGREVDGEADFVVAHPNRGILTVEVKGGIVARDGASDSWTSRDRHGFSHSIKNPVKQAHDSKHQLLKKLKAHPLWRDAYVVMAHAVLLPDCERPLEDLGPDMPLKIFGFADDLHALEKWAESRLAETGHTGKPLGSDGLHALEDLLARSFEMRSSLRTAMAAEDHEIHTLTEQQFHILDYVTRVRRLVIEGGAGSGKTVMAMELAIRCGERGDSVLLTCFNRPLAEQLKRTLKNADGVTVRGFHELCVWMAGRAGLAAPVLNNNLDADRKLTENLVEAFALTGQSWNTIIVDEAQDFAPVWIAALEAALPTLQGNLYIFGDSNQRIYTSRSAFAGDNAEPFPLNRNLRNTKQIFDLARRFYSGEGYTSAGPEGQVVEWIADGDASREDTVVHTLSRLVAREMVGAGDIAVLVCGNQQSAEQLRQRVGRKYATTDAETRKHGCVIVDTVRRFKGLESRVVILVGVDAISDSDELLYVAFSRANLYMLVLGSAAVLARLRGSETVP